MCNKWLIKLFCFQKERKFILRALSMVPPNFCHLFTRCFYCFKGSIYVYIKFHSITTNIRSLHNNVLIINSLLTFIINYSIHFYPHTLHWKQILRNHLRYDYVHFRRFYSSPPLPLPMVFLLQHQHHCLVIP